MNENKTGLRVKDVVIKDGEITFSIVGPQEEIDLISANKLEFKEWIAAAIFEAIDECAELCAEEFIKYATK